jgi:hypothetical protein
MDALQMNNLNDHSIQISILWIGENPDLVVMSVSIENEEF